MRLPRKPRAVVFDMDGLIFDSERLHSDAFKAAAHERRHSISDECILGSVGLSAAATQEKLVEYFGVGFDVAAYWADTKRHYQNLLISDLQLKPGIMQLLDVLDAHGLPRAIATSSPHADVERNLHTHNLTGRFSAIIAQGDYARSKPNPDPFIRAAKSLGIAPEDCLALEDSYNGVRSASAAGMMTIMVPDLLPENEEMYTLCVHISADLNEVLTLL